jgi:hypothetical protein
MFLTKTGSQHPLERYSSPSVGSSHEPIFLLGCGPKVIRIFEQRLPEAWKRQTKGDTPESP